MRMDDGRFGKTVGKLKRKSTSGYNHCGWVERLVIMVTKIRVDFWLNQNPVFYDLINFFFFNFHD